MLSIIAEKGEYFHGMFRFQLEQRHWSLKERINTGQQITWSEESVVIVSSVLMVRKGFPSQTFNITLELHMSFLSLRVPVNDSFLELWTYELWIEISVSERLTSSKIQHKDTGEHLLLKANFLTYLMGF